MFRALLLIILLTGTAQQTDLPTRTDVHFSSEVEHLQVGNFQYMDSDSHFSTDDISAKAALVTDLDTQMPLIQINTAEKRPIASLAKLITALVILEEHTMSDVVTVSPDVNETIGSKIWLYPGEQITVENLLKGMLIKSGNDAAYELAKFNAGTLEAFSQKMNAKAALLGLKNSAFLDPAGLDDENNFSTAADLAIVAKHILKNDFVRKIVSIRETSIFSVDGKLEHHLRTTNLLLGSSLGAKGLKTGTTNAAGQCLITLVEINGNDVLIIILGSEDRYKDTRKIYNYLSSV